MKDALHEDGIGAARNFFEEIAGDEPSPTGDAQPMEMRTRLCFAPRKVERNTFKMWVVLKHTADQFAGTAADIHHHARSREIVSRYDLWNNRPREADHRGVEPASPFGCIAGCSITIVIAAQLCRCLTRANRIGQSGP